MIGTFKKKNKKIKSNKLNAPVQHIWLFTLPWKIQTVINQGLRAPDSHFCPNIKIVSRWLRSVSLRNADDTHTFMCRKDELPTIENLENEMNYCSLHFVTHFLYALEIVGYKHPNKEIRKTSFQYYKRFVEEICHFGLETEKQLDIRLSDNTDVPSFSEDFCEIIKNHEESDFKYPSKCPPPEEDDYIW